MEKEKRPYFEFRILKHLQICRLILARTPGEHLVRKAIEDLRSEIDDMFSPSLDEIEKVNDSDEWKKVKKVLF